MPSAWRTSRHRRDSEILGREVTVFVTPGSKQACESGGKSAAFVGVVADGSVVWQPKGPVCLAPLYDADSSEGRREAADAALDFFEHDLSAGGVPPRDRLSVLFVVGDTRETLRSLEATLLRAPRREVTQLPFGGGSFDSALLRSFGNRTRFSGVATS